MTAVHTFSHIVAVSKNFCIGKNNQLPWHISEDLKRFKQITTGHVIVMGRNTFDSIGKPLPNRMNIVLSRTLELLASENLKVCKNIEEMKDLLPQLSSWPREIFIIGGGKVYEVTQNLIQKIYLTRVLMDVDGDAFYPQKLVDQFKRESSEELKTANADLLFETYLK